jgi:hypothetical protein
MPFINRDGNVAHGVAGVGAFLNNVQFDTGGGACWFDKFTIAYQHQAADGTYLALYDLNTRQWRRAITDPNDPRYGKGANTIGAGGGVWAAWLAGFGLYTSNGWINTDAALLTVGDGGEVIYIEHYHTGYPVRVREKDGRDWLLSEAAVLDADGYGHGNAIWTTYDNVVHVHGELPVPLVIGDVCFRPRAAYVNGEWWISYFSSLVGVVAHPFRSTVGYSIVAVGDCWQDVSARDYHATVLDVAYATTQGEAAGSIVALSIDVATAPRADLTPGPEPQPPDPQPPDPEPEDEMKPPIVTVDKFTLDDVLDGREIAFHDDGNPELQISGRVFVEGTNMRVTLTNKAGTASTGAQRTVHPCSQGTTPEPQPPEPQPEPEPPTTFSLRTCFGTFLAVDKNKFLTQVGSLAEAATFEESDLGNGLIALACNGLFVAAEPDYRCKADRQEASSDAGSWEKWRLQENQDDTVSYLSWANRYLSSHEDGTVRADQPAIGGWESLTKDEPPPSAGARPPIDGPLTRDSWFFRNAHGHPTRYQGLSAFPLARRHADGVDIQPFLDCFPGANVARLFDYVTWEGTGWEPPSIEQMKAFFAWMRDRGWYVELCMLTDHDPARIGPADQRVRAFAGTPNLLIEIGNEPQTNKDIDTQCLRAACEASGLLYSSGDYEDSKYWHGHFLTAHTPRDNQWSRKAHDLLEYHNGHGPSYPEEPACKCPCVGDEPIKPIEAPTWWGNYGEIPNAKVLDFRAYGGVCAVLGAGATFHFEGGKFCDLPTADDRACFAAMMEGLTAFPADVPGGSYRTIDEGGELDDDSRGSRTYIVGERAMVRVRPLTITCPEAGWTPLDADGILFAR